MTWQVGTLDSYIGDLGLYDMRPAQIFFETVGLSGRYQNDTIDLLLGVGDSGYGIRGADYSTILTPGGWLRLHANDHFEIGAGGQYRFEPSVPGSRTSPYLTPEPHRGKRNTPANIPVVGQRMAEVLDVAVEDLADRVWDTTHTFYGLPEPA